MSKKLEDYIGYDVSPETVKKVREEMEGSPLTDYDIIESDGCEMSHTDQ